MKFNALQGGVPERGFTTIAMIHELLDLSTLISHVGK